MIIGCPACHTKFSVDAQQLAEVENPRFHCSRCGHVFDLRDADKQSESESTEEEENTVENSPSSDSLAAPHEAEEEAPTESRQVTEDLEQYFAEDADAEQLPLLPEKDKAEELRSVSITQTADAEFEVDSIIEDVAPIDWPSSSEELPVREPHVDVSASESAQAHESLDHYADTEILDAEEVEYTQSDPLADTAVDDPLSGVTVDWDSNRNESDVYSVEPPEDLSAFEVRQAAPWSTGESEAEHHQEDDIDEVAVEYSASEDSQDEEYFESPDEITPVTLDSGTLESGESPSNEKPFSSKGTMRTWIDPVLPSQASKSQESQAPERPSDSGDLKNLFGVDWQEAEIGEESESDAEAATPESSEPFHRNTLFEGVEDTEIGSRSSVSESENEGWSSGEKSTGASMSKSFTEVITRPEIEGEPGTPKNKVIDLREAPSVERERVKRKARKRAARHERLLSDEDSDSFSDFSDSPRLSVPQQGFPALLVVWSVPLLLTGFFCLWSYHVDSTPQFLKNAFNMSADSLPKTAPAGLALIDLNSKIVALDDGTKVLEIEGRLFNATVETFRDVRLEAKVYDQQNRALSEIRIGFHNGLVNARLAALKEEAIEALQSKQGMGDALVKPNVKAPFRIVITGLTGAEQWFSARVLSVESETA